jgi:hypothetical protein
MRPKEPSEYLPSRSTLTIVMALVIVAIVAFAYYTYQYVERHTVSPQSPPVITQDTTTAPQASAPAPASSERAPHAPPVESTTPEPEAFVAPEVITTPEPQVSVQFRCDGRTRCSHMTSCEEAKFFLRNCPGTQMDGDNDGIPCEQQWCNSPF